MIQVNNSEETIAKLRKLTPDAKPLWGSMTPQQMVEHITMTVKASNGKVTIEQRTTKEEGEAAKPK
jgi:oxepin-CoA hydrolase/3-oxo-5,6-dehydrosuberyl-CoA semialdehyde dehydrogenase